MGISRKVPACSQACGSCDGSACALTWGDSGQYGVDILTVFFLICKVRIIAD